MDEAQRSTELYERMLAGELYKVDGPAFASRFERGMAIMDKYNALPAADRAGRRELAKELFKSIGENVTVRSPIHVDYGCHISIDSGTFINYDCIFLDVAEIKIGRNVLIAPRAQFYTAWHPLEVTPRIAGWEGASPITIEDNVWIGGGAMILPGVTIGKNSIVGTGSVVTKDVPPNVIVAGNPARVLRELPADRTVADVIPEHLLGPEDR